MAGYRYLSRYVPSLVITEQDSVLPNRSCSHFPLSYRGVSGSFDPIQMLCFTSSESGYCTSSAFSNFFAGAQTETQGEAGSKYTDVQHKPNSTCICSCISLLNLYCMIKMPKKPSLVYCWSRQIKTQV